MHRIFLHWTSILAVLLVWTTGISAMAHAQQSSDNDANDPVFYRTRFAAGGAFSIADPKEDFRANVGRGYGFTGTFQYHLDREGWFNLRFDGSWFQYGREKQRVPFSRTVGERVFVDVITTNSILDFAFRPEMAVPRGPVRPYINAGFSGLWFRTVSTVSHTDGEDIADTTNLSDRTGAWVVGGGFRVPLGGRDSGAALDLGARYHRGGHASYLREGSIIDNPDGTITLAPLNSRTPFIVYSIGFRYRFGFESSDPCPAWVC